MLIGGIEKLSLLDYPNKLAAIVFTMGCNFRCGYCHNPELVDPKQFPPALREESVLDFLEKRRGILDAVVITGGEPTLYPDLASFIRQVKDMGFLVKLDTNGTFPSRVRPLIEAKLIDYLAMDIKGSPEKYSLITGAKIHLNNIEESVRMIMESGLPYEFRTTVVPRYFEKKDFEAMGKMISGAKQYYIQQFRAQKTLSLNEKEKAFSPEELESFRITISPYVQYCEIRGI